MKRILFLFSFLSVVALSFAQEDTVHIDLTAYQHTHIIAYMPDKAHVDRNRYIYTVLPQIEIIKDSTGKNILKYPGKVIRYAAPVTLLEDLFFQIGSNQERLVAADNRAIQLSLNDQLQRRPDVLLRIGIMVKNNAAENDRKVQVDGIDYLARLKE